MIPDLPGDSISLTDAWEEELSRDPSRTLEDEPSMSLALERKSLDGYHMKLLLCCLSVVERLSLSSDELISLLPVEPLGVLEHLLIEGRNLTETESWWTKPRPESVVEEPPPPLVGSVRHQEQLRRRRFHRSLGIKELVGQPNS